MPRIRLARDPAEFCKGCPFPRGSGKPQPSTHTGERGCVRTSPPCPRGPFCGTGRSSSDSVLPWVERSRKASTQSRKIRREAFQPGSLQRVTVVTSLSGTLGEWTVAKAPRRAHPLDDVPASLSPQSEVTRSFRATISGCPSGQRLTPPPRSGRRARGCGAGWSRDSATPCRGRLHQGQGTWPAGSQ